MSALAADIPPKDLMHTKSIAVSTSCFAVCLLMILGGCTCKVTSSSERAFQDLVRSSLGSNNFVPTRLDDHTVVLVSSSSGRRFFSRQNIETFQADAKARGETYEASDFKALDTEESEKSRFASITYDVTYKVSKGNKTTLVHVRSHEIWERQVDGFHRLFATIESSNEQ